MDVTFIGIVCFIDNNDGTFTAALPDGTRGVHPCKQGNGKTDPHFPAISVVGVKSTSNWPNCAVIGQSGFFPIMSQAELTIGNIKNGSGVGKKPTGLLSLKKGWDPKFTIDVKGKSYRNKCITWVEINDGDLIADLSGTVTSTNLNFAASADVTVTLGSGAQAPSFTVDPAGSISILNTSWGPHRGGSHFYLYYLLDQAPACVDSPVKPDKSPHPFRSVQLDSKGNVHMFSLMADCSNTTYP